MFGQRTNLPKIEVVKDQSCFVDLLTSPEIEITGILPINNHSIYVSWVHSDDSLECSDSTNVVIAALLQLMHALNYFRT